MIQILLMANHTEHEWEWKGEVYKCQPGQFVTSLDSLKNVCAKDVSLRNIRTCISILERWQFLTNKSTKTGRLITIINWNTYLVKPKKSTKKPTKNRQRPDKDLTTNKNVKNEKNDKNIKTLPPALFQKYYELSKTFHDHQKAQHPNLVKNDETVIVAGAKELDRLIRIDQHDFDFIRVVLGWGVRDKFWSTQLRSLASIRNKGNNGSTKFDNLVANYEREKQATPEKRLLSNALACEEFVNGK